VNTSALILNRQNVSGYDVHAFYVFSFENWLMQFMFGSSGQMRRLLDLSVKKFTSFETSDGSEKKLCLLQTDDSK
jgi:hypothetical protein